MNTVLDGLDSSLADVLGGRLVATYVHGSLALGGFEPTRSDIDVLVIVRDSPRTGAAEWHELAKRVPVTGAAARGVELSDVELGAVAKPAAPWPFLLHVTTAPDDRKVIDGRRRAGDHDLLMHYVFARAAGQVGRGPPPADLIGDVDRRSVLRYLRDELDWGLRHAGETYAVLNAGRAVRYARDGVSFPSSPVRAPHSRPAHRRNSSSGRSPCRPAAPLIDRPTTKPGGSSPPCEPSWRRLRPDPYTSPMSNPESGHPEPVAVGSYATEGEAEVAQAKLRAFGIEAFLDDQIEGGTVVVDGEPGVRVQVRAHDASEALRILIPDGDLDGPDPPPS
ncbi:MAG: nucleotidyltransferase domain-containing protein [Ilumatobacteraceae bacterium]